MEAISVALLGSGILREGLHRILSENSFVVSLSTKNIADVWPSLENGMSFDVIVIDDGILRIEDELYIRLQRELPEVAIVVLADNFEFEPMVNAFRSGASGYN